MDLFWLKKFVSLFLHPLPLLIGAILLGLVLYFYGRGVPRPKRGQPGWSRDSMDEREKRRRRRRRWGVFGITLTWISLLMMYLLGLGPVSKMIITPLEGKYAILDKEKLSADGDAPKFIVVLGGGYARANGYPITSRLSQGTTLRVAEAVRVHQLLPESKLIFTGGDQVAGEDKRSTVADGMAEFARMMGVSNANILLERDSRDTSEHPVKILPLIGEERRVILVTSAMHMPRSMALFEKQGFIPIAAPAGVTPSGPGPTLADFIPGAGSYTRIDAAVHEYLGLLWAKMRGKID
jgi:uncharacterized SAM-binding protein YcdF (DUF218 family)